MNSKLKLEEREEADRYVWRHYGCNGFPVVKRGARKARTVNLAREEIQVLNPI
jgi:hypothetical protein